MNKKNQNKSNSNESLDLHKVCRLGDISLIKKIYQANPEQINSLDQKLENLQATQFLLEKGADPNVKNNLGESALHLACESSQQELVQLLIQYNADINCQQNDGDTPLHQATFRGDLPIVQLLLEKGASVNIQNQVFGCTPFHYAAESGFLDIIQEMLKYGANARIRNRKGQTALQITKSIKVQKYLKEIEEIQEDRILQNDQSVELQKT